MGLGAFSCCIVLQKKSASVGHQYPSLVYGQCRNPLKFSLINQFTQIRRCLLKNILLLFLPRIQLEFTSATLKSQRVGMARELFYKLVDMNLSRLFILMARKWVFQKILDLQQNLMSRNLFKAETMFCALMSLSGQMQHLLKIKINGGMVALHVQ